MSTSANMLLPIPTVGGTDGPDYADQVNASLEIIDQHDHSTGKGVPVTPAGLSISSDLTFQGNNATGLRSARFSSQGATLALPTDLNCLSVVNGNLYYNNGSGVAVQITNGGSIVGTSGSIGGLVSPASATYIPATEKFVWQADTNKPANMDFASAIFRNNTVSSFGVTVSPPAALGADYALVLPSLPASQKFMTLDASGNMGAPWAVDGSSLEISSNTLQIKDSGVTTAKIANDAVTTAKILDANVTRPKLVAVGQQISSSSSSFSTASTSLIDVTNLTVTLTTTGRPVMLFLEATGSGLPRSEIYISWGATGSAARLAYLRDATQIALTTIRRNNDSSLDAVIQSVTQPYLYLDTPAAGTYVYKVQVLIDDGTINVSSMRLVGYEL